MGISTEVKVTYHHEDPLNPPRWDVWVSTEQGMSCLVEFVHDTFQDTYVTKIAGDLLVMSPEAITAILSKAILAVRDERTRIL